MSTKYVVKPIEFVYEDTEWCSDEQADAWGVFDTTPIKCLVYNRQSTQIPTTREAYPFEWDAAFRDKEDALQFCKERNSL